MEKKCKIQIENADGSKINVECDLAVIIAVDTLPDQIPGMIGVKAQTHIFGYNDAPYLVSALQQATKVPDKLLDMLKDSDRDGLVMAVLETRGS